ncbi:MAG: PAS domain S-box protein, partial [Thermoleophilaceae bacterium]
RERDEARSALSRAERELERIRTALEGAKRERDEVRRTLQSTAGEEGRTRAALEAITQERDEARAELATAAADRDEAHRNAATATTELEKLRAELQSVAAERNDTQRAAAAATSAREELRAALEGAVAERDDARAKLEALRRQAQDGRESERNEARAELESATAALAAAEAKLSEATSERDGLRTSLAQAATERDDAVAALDAATRDRDSAQAALERAVARSHHEAETSRAGLVDLAASADELRGRLADERDRRAGLERKIAEDRRRLAEEHRRAAELELRVAELEAERERGFSLPPIPSELAPDPLPEDPSNVRAGLDDVPTPRAHIDFQGHFSALNAAFCTLVGYSEREFRMAAWPPIVDAESREALRELTRRMASGEIESAPVRTRYMHAEGLLVPISGTITVERDDSGRPLHMVLDANAPDRMPVGFRR